MSNSNFLSHNKLIMQFRPGAWCRRNGKQNLCVVERAAASNGNTYLYTKESSDTQSDIFKDGRSKILRQHLPWMRRIFRRFLSAFRTGRPILSQRRRGSKVTILDGDSLNASDYGESMIKCGCRRHYFNFCQANMTTEFQSGRNLENGWPLNRIGGEEETAGIVRQIADLCPVSARLKPSERLKSVKLLYQVAINLLSFRAPAGNPERV